MKKYLVLKLEKRSVYLVGPEKPLMTAMRHFHNICRGYLNRSHTKSRIRLRIPNRIG